MCVCVWDSPGLVCVWILEPMSNQKSEVFSRSIFSKNKNFDWSTLNSQACNTEKNCEFARPRKRNFCSQRFLILLFRNTVNGKTYIKSNFLKHIYKSTVGIYRYSWTSWQRSTNVRCLSCMFKTTMRRRRSLNRLHLTTRV